MAEHKVWAILNRYDERLQAVVIDQPIGDSLVTRCVEATLTIPDEPEWRVVFYNDDGVLIAPNALKGVLGPNVVIVRAPDAQQALAKALAERNGG